MLCVSGSACPTQRHIDRANPLLVRVREPRSPDKRIRHFGAIARRLTHDPVAGLEARVVFCGKYDTRDRTSLPAYCGAWTPTAPAAPARHYEGIMGVDTVVGVEPRVASPGAGIARRSEWSSAIGAKPSTNTHGASSERSRLSRTPPSSTSSGSRLSATAPATYASPTRMTSTCSSTSSSSTKTYALLAMGWCGYVREGADAE
jgi:hypothetical protein